MDGARVGVDEGLKLPIEIDPYPAITALTGGQQASPGAKFASHGLAHSSALLQ